MTAIKLDSKLPTNGVPDGLAQSMWDGLGSRHMAIVEVRVSERTEPADSLDTDPSAKIRVTAMEFAPDSEDAERLRQALRDRWAARTAQDTLDSTADMHDPSDPAVGFHDALLGRLQERGQIKGYPVAVEMTPDGGLTITVGPDLIEPVEDDHGQEPLPVGEDVTVEVNGRTVETVGELADALHH